MSSRRITVRAFAKVNLVLDLIGPLPGGYTEIATVFQTIDLHDRVHMQVQPGPRREITLESSGLDLDCPAEKNLAVRAAAAWAEAADWTGRIEIRLEKSIPSQAGLGGGSADAAGVLVGLETIADNPLGRTRQTEIARNLGADVPFLLQGGLAIGRGRGDEIEPLADLRPWPIVLASAGPGLSTAEVFRRARSGLTPGAKAPNIQRFLRYLHGDRAEGPPLSNGLFSAAGELREGICRMVSLFESLGGLSTMTGSGSVVFALFDQEAAAFSAAEAVSDAVPGAWVYVGSTLPARDVDGQRLRRLQGEE